MRLYVSLVVATLLACAAPAARGQTTKVAVANAARIFNEMQETKDLKQKMENDRKGLSQTEEEKKQHLRDLQAARDQLRPESPQYQEKNRELLQAAIEFETWGKLMQADVQRAQKQQMRSLFDKIQSAIGEVAQQKGFDIVVADNRAELPDNLDTLNVDQLRALINQRNIMFADAKVDLSNDVIAMLDARYKGKK